LQSCLGHPNTGVEYMSNTTRKVLSAVAALAASTLVIGAALPASAVSEDKVLKINAILPLSGALAFLNPPMLAGANLAVDEINKAGGVLGSKVVLNVADSGDGSNLAVSSQSATAAIAAKADVVLGALRLVLPVTSSTRSPAQRSLRSRLRTPLLT